jgi:hypothetical protein
LIAFDFQTSQMSGTIDLFEMTTRCSRRTAPGDRSRATSNVPTPTMSRAVSIEKELAAIQDNSISQTQKLKDYFKKLECDFPDQKLESGSTLNDDDNEDESEDENDEEETDNQAPVNDPNDLLSSNNLVLSYSLLSEGTFPARQEPSSFIQSRSLLSEKLQNNYKLKFQTVHCYEDSLKRSLTKVVQEELISSVSKLMVTGTSEETDKSISLIPFWDFLQDKKRVGTHSQNSSLDVSYLIVLFLHQCMERSLKETVKAMIRSFQEKLCDLVIQHPLVKSILPLLMSSGRTSKAEKILFLCDLMISYYQKFNSKSGKTEKENNDDKNNEEKKKEILKEEKRNFFASPNFLLYILLLLQRKEVSTSSSSLATHSSAHVVFRELIEEFLYIQYHLLPKDTDQWNRDPVNNKYNNDIILKLMNTSLQLQIILSVFIVQGNEVFELQKMVSRQGMTGECDDESKERKERLMTSVKPVVGWDPLPASSSSAENDENDKLMPFLADVFWYSVNEVLYHYRIIVPLLSFIVRSSVLFITLYERFVLFFNSHFLQFFFKSFLLVIQ